MIALNQYHSQKNLPGDEAVRLAVLLDMKQPLKMDYLGLANSIANGLTLKNVESIAGFINTLQPNGIHKIISEATLRRARGKKDRKLSRESSERLYEISRVIDQAALVFHGDEEKIQRFMTRPNPLLNRKTPFEVAYSSSAGANTVIKLLMEAQAGVAI